jgi:hypothetical protein
MKTNLFIIAAVLVTAVVTTGVSAQTQAPAASAPSEIVYVPQLPDPSDLIREAKTEGSSVAKIDQTSSQVIVAYKNADGQISTVVYRPMSAVESAAAPMAAVIPAPASPTTVIYSAPEPVYYYPAYSYYPNYYPWGWYPPVSVRVGFGFRAFGGFHGRWR